MLSSCTNSSYKLSKILIFILFSISTSSWSYGQSCGCVDPPDCAPCQGSLTSITFRYNGPDNPLNQYRVEDDDGLLASGFITGDIIVNSRDFGEPFEDDELEIQVGYGDDFDDEIDIETTCDEIQIGQEFDNGRITIISAVSANSGNICCTPIPPSILNCVDQDGCEPCQGSLTSLTFRFNGPENTLNRYRVEDGDGVLASGFITGDITINSRDFGVPFEDDELEIQVGFGSDFNNDFDVETTCDKIQIGQEFDNGRITIISAVSAVSGPICCAPLDVDETPPVLANCPTDITISASATCETTVNWTAPTATDNCTAEPTLTASHNAGDDFPIGTTEVTYTATDENGNTETCSFIITVIDESAPVFTACPQDVIFSAHGSCEAAVTWAEPNITDNCDEDFQLLQSHQNGDTFPLGETIVTYTAADVAGNTANCTFTVTVIDDTPPVLVNCPTDIIISASATCETTVNWTPPTATDNCSAEPTITASHNSGDDFPLGTTEVTYAATDENGNTETCSFVITVIDESAPVFTACPQDVIFSAHGSCEAAVTWAEPNITDNCDEDFQLVQSHESGDTFPLGETIVTYTAIDAAGNTANCTFTVTVIDDTPPVLANCPTDITISASATCETTVNWTPPTTTDNCTAEPTLTASHNAGDNFPLGTTEVTYTATDENGNTETCSFVITVIDESAPVFTACPQDVIFSAHGSCEAAVTWAEPNITDNCDEDFQLVQSHESGDTFPLGETIVTYTATDVAGNTANCTFTVTVVDDTAPVFSNCPESITVKTQEGCEKTVSWEAPTITDNCTTEPIVVQNYNSGDVFPLGTTLVEYSVTDHKGNNSICSFEINVVDEISPIFSDCPANIEVLADISCDGTVEWSAPIVSDNCSVSSLQSNFESGDDFPIGKTEVIYSALDQSGNKANCSFIVNVINPFEPQLSYCPADITVDVYDAEYITIDWDEPLLEWDCATENLQSTDESGDRFPVGNTEVKYSYIFEGETVIACSFIVTVISHETAFDIPKILTPNNDGSNDEWSLGRIEEFPDNQVIIIDRWGNEIYKVSSYNNVEKIWRGEDNRGDIVPNGTYFYFIKVISGSSVIEKTGFLELIR